MEFLINLTTKEVSFLTTVSIISTTLVLLRPNEFPMSSIKSRLFFDNLNPV